MKMIFESNSQQELFVRAKRGKSVGDSPTSATSPGQKEKKGRVRFTNVRFRKYRARDSLP